jgi:hypothetical protein
MDNITLYHPGDGITANSNTILYKNIKEFKDNGDGTISFKTQKFGDITTPLPWRLAKNAPAEAAEEPAGNQANKKKVVW